MGIQDFHSGHVKSVSACPLCGEPIVRTCEYCIETGKEPVFSIGGGCIGVAQRYAPMLRIKWMCAGGCEIEVKGKYNEGRVNCFEDIENVPVDVPQAPKHESLTGENLRELSPKVEQARHALAELGEGIDYAKSERRSKDESGRSSSSG
jgi:hypothetical protein